MTWHGGSDGDSQVTPEARSAEDTETRSRPSASPPEMPLHQRLDPRRILKLDHEDRLRRGRPWLHQRLDPRRILKRRRPAPVAAPPP